jgi:hypothetical protein
MKILSALLAALFLTALVPAQDAAKPGLPPDIEVLSKSWRREAVHAKLGDDPMRANDQQRDTMIEQKKATEYNATKGSRERPIRPETADSSQPSVEMPKDASLSYLYQAKIKNTGSKTIKLVEWAYVIIDSESKETINRFQSVNKVKINSGKSADLIISTPTPPSNLVDAGKSKKGQAQFIEEIDISRIEYSDGSVWQRPEK